MGTFRDHSCLALLVAACLLACGFLPGWTSVAGAAGGVSLDGSLGPKGPVGPGTLPDGTSTTYLIADTLGKKAGGNLFFSFDKFNIYTGESATFHSPGSNSFNNIISRVTGGSPSAIDGLLRSTIDGANLFLVNPSGVMFGPNASLDLKGSLHVSTADYLKFSDGGVFYANPELSSVLSVATPEAFGFLNGNPAGISGDRAFLQVPDGKTLSFIGGDISYRGDPAAPANLISAPSGRINLVSVASPGEVNLSAPDLGMSSFTRLGNITLFDTAYLTVMNADPYTQPAGSVFIRGGRLSFKDAGIDAGGNPAGTVDVKGESLLMDSFYFFTDSYGEVNHPGTGCLIELSGDLEFKNASWIDSSSFGSGRAGDILIKAVNMTLGNATPGEGYSHNTTLNYGVIVSTAFGAGRGGDISLTTGNLVVQNGYLITTSTYYDWGDAGNITVRADSLKCLNKSNISSVAYGFGKGGVVDISARDILLSAAHEKAVKHFATNTGIGAEAEIASDGGKILLHADNLQILDGARISTILRGSGRGADAEIDAKNISISGFVRDPTLPIPYLLSSIDARVYGAAATGTGGNLNIRTDNLKITDYGVVRTGLYAGAEGEPSGKAGNINIGAGEIELKNRGQIYADSFRGTGDSGDINISAGNMSITGVGSSSPPSPFGIEFTGLSTTTNTGRGGTINVSLTGDLSMKSRGGISAETRGSGPGGAINIGANNAQLSGGSTISAATSGSGKAGNISILARNLFKMDNSLVTTAADFAQGGNINVQAKDIQLRNGAVISAESSGAGNAGDIGIMASNLFESRNSAVTTEARAADGGNVQANVGYMLRLIDSKITTSVGGGPQTVGGNIDVDSNYVILQNSRIIANAYEGRGGNIGIDAGTFLADPNSIVDASSALGIDGTVDIRAVVQSIAGVVQPLPKNFVSAGDLLRTPCEARLKGDKAGSLVVKGRDGLPVEPGGFLPSPM